MKESHFSGGHSADVQITLHVNGSALRVATVGPDRIYLDAPQHLMRTSGKLVIFIDGHTDRRRVILKPQTRPDRVVSIRLESQV